MAILISTVRNNNNFFRKFKIGYDVFYAICPRASRQCVTPLIETLAGHHLIYLIFLIHWSLQKVSSTRYLHHVNFIFSLQQQMANTHLHLRQKIIRDKRLLTTRAYACTKVTWFMIMFWTVTEWFLLSRKAIQSDGMVCLEADNRYNTVR